MTIKRYDPTHEPRGPDDPQWPQDWKCEGWTKGLDRAVANNAAWLDKLFRKDVTITFNENRDYGRAIISYFDGFGVFSVQLGSGLITPGEYLPEILAIHKKGRKIYHTVHMSWDAVKPDQQQDVGHGKEGLYIRFYCVKVDDARKIILDRVDRDKFPVYP